MLEQLFITFQILIIDVVMAADNAIIIGLIAANFALIIEKNNSIRCSWSFYF